MKTRPRLKCSIPNCSSPLYRKPYCSRHSTRFYRYGDPLTVSPNKNKLIRWLKATSFSDEMDECINWPFSKDNGGYGQFKWEGMRGAHRVMCRLRHGPPPHKSYEAAHSCSKNRLCVNPNHLSWKTPKANRADKLFHDTHIRGERNHKAKLTEKDVRKIRELLADKVTGRAIATRYNVTPALISRIKKGLAWAWLD